MILKSKFVKKTNKLVCLVRFDKNAVTKGAYYDINYYFCNIITAFMNVLNRISITFLVALCSLIAIQGKDFVIVIDAGHGGKDFGALGAITNEKKINLGVALKLGDMIKSQMKDVKVVFTRDDDTFLSLKERSELANKANGDLFISIHTNSVDKRSRNRKTVKGASTYTLGLHRSEDNLEVAIRENSVIELEKDYTKTYKGFDPNSAESYIIFEMSQSKHIEQSVEFASLVQKQFVDVADRVDKGVKQAGFWVLAHTSMPAVLVELDFICNPTEERFLASENGQEKMAESIYNAIITYKKTYHNQDNALQKGTSVETRRQLDSEALQVDNSEVKTAVEIDTNNDDNTGYSIRKEKKPTKKKSKKTKTPASETKSIDNVELDAGQTPPQVSSETETVHPQDNSIDKGQESQQTTESATSSYKIQFLTSDCPIEDNKSFKGLYPVEYYFEDGLYKYTYGDTSSLKEANRILRTVKSKFKGAFIVRFKDNKRVKK